MTDENSPKEEIIEVLREGRAKPDYILQVTSINAQQTLDHHLRGLRAAGRVEYVHDNVDGFYRLAESRTCDCCGQRVPLDPKTDYIPPEDPDPDLDIELEDGALDVDVEELADVYSTILGAFEDADSEAVLEREKELVEKFEECAESQDIDPDDLVFEEHSPTPAGDEDDE